MQMTGFPTPLAAPLDLWQAVGEKRKGAPMAEHDADSLTDAVIDRLAGKKDGRHAEIMAATVKHLHALVKDIRLQPDEWACLIDFLTATGKISGDKRQEFILLSDILGVSMLMEILNQPPLDKVTDATILGPFHRENTTEFAFGQSIARHLAPDTVMSGRVTDQRGTAIGGAKIEVWQAGPDGHYDVQKSTAEDLRGTFSTTETGHYEFRTVLPQSYPIPTDGPVGDLLAASGGHPYRPAHIHFKITTEGFHPLTTHLFVAGDEFIGSDAVFAVRSSLIVDFRRGEDGLYHGAFDFVLAPARVREIR